MIKKYLETGKIVGTHGIKGMVRVKPWSDSGDFLTAFKRFYLDNNGEHHLTATKIQPHGNVVIIAFKGIDTIEAAEALRNKILYIDRKDVTLPEGRYFIDDLIGCEVFDADNTEIKYGTIKDVESVVANDIWYIDTPDGEVIIPAIKDVVINCDVENNKVFIRPLRGLFSDED